MIANSHAHGRYSVLEEGEIDRHTLQFCISHYLVCDPQGDTLEPTFVTLEAARAFIDSLETPQ